MEEKRLTLLKTLNALAFLIMIAVNILANALPINGLTTGEVSGSYSNLFAPAALTFAVWGVIYPLMGLFVLFSFGVFKGNSGYSDKAVGRIKYCFIISSVANSMWIFAWHYQKIGITLILMLFIFLSLALSFIRINSSELSRKENLFINIPFGVYFGWITIATIANIVTYLVRIGWDGFGLSDENWMMIVVLVGLIITGITIFKFKNIGYALVVIWAYIGILIKHMSTGGFDKAYTGVIVLVAISLAVFIIETLIIWLKKNKR